MASPVCLGISGAQFLHLVQWPSANYTIYVSSRSLNASFSSVLLYGMILFPCVTDQFLLGTRHCEFYPVEGRIFLKCNSPYTLFCDVVKLLGNSLNFPDLALKF